MKLNKYQSNTALQENHHQIFIEQTPTAIAMLDKDMVYLAVSQRWLKDYKLDEQDVIGRCHYDVFPEIGGDWKKDHQECLKGAINICEEAPFYRADGTTQWIYWDVRPWYNAEGEIGGLMMHTGDITEQKEKELKERKFNTILSDTSEIARIGTWEIDFVQEKVTWSNMVYEIHEVPLDYEPTIASGFDFFEDEESRNRIGEALKEAQEIGTPVNLNLNLKTAKGNNRWIKVIGKVERTNGVSTKIFGITQDITSSMISEQKLTVAHAELEAIFNSDAIAVITTDVNGIINRFNKGAEKLLGYTADEIIGLKKPELYLMKEELDEFKNNITKLFRGDTFVEDENYNYRNENINDTRQWTFRRKDGSTFSTLTSITAINSSLGVNDGFISVVTDISKIKDVKNELRKKNDLLNLAERISLIGHWKWDPNNDIGSWSDNLYSIFDYHIEPIKITFKLYFDMILDEDRGMVLKHFENANETKVFQKLRHRVRTFSGNIKTIEILAKVFCNEKGELLEMIGTCQDVTESKKAEQKIIEAKEELEIVAQKLSYQNKQLADFTHITSHNLRAPVANLNSLMEIYKLTEDERERLDIFQKFDTVINRLTLTLNSLIEALKTKISDAQEELESVDLNDIFEDTTQTLSGSILTSGAVIKGDFRELSTITYNRIYMDSIFLNIIGNAIKYKAKDRAPEIIVKSKVKNGRNIITFKDNGLGIDLERHGHKLFGLNKVFHRHPDAKGVGLFLTKTQVEAMGGTITATSEVNVGTTFTIIF
ncbi:PAS domain S-box protein [Maribacter sp. 1_MG-2023]|uniref:PAS domain-containing sensor histidine kinase n=1 Tax=Maribacter sp. 1_MG-2023 TaxID=3062677 RepID=UPI0026E495FE|nr:PAS domain S-box protein [Maribacter sp. 1_MG-2023]MDO6470814.1 PAS domain S-box protein [Maribacter sp. 1_MG-2023]